jgi:hypothetical protein
MTSESADEVARISVTRTDPGDIRDRQIVVSIDGEPLGTLLFGQLTALKQLVRAL